MKITRVTLNQYRNYASASLEPCSEVTLLVGKNAQGKTNLVESLVFGSTTKSPRTSDISELILDGAERASVNIEVERKFGKLSIGYSLSRKGEKQFYINQNPVSRLSEVFSNLVVIYFCPTDLKIVSGSPQERRDFMDTDISQLSGSYYNLLQRYNKILMQRNKLLKFEKNIDELKLQLEVWDEQLASVAALIIKTRRGFIDKLKEPANQAIKYISSSQDELAIEYVGAGANSKTAEEIKAELLKSLKYNLERDIELGYTSIGPHRDDIYLGLNKKDARSFSSQGQQRSIVLALKFAEMEIFTSEIGESPVLILDDVFSELDSSRQKNLFKKMSEFQAIVTGTIFKFKPEPPYLKVTIDKGKLKPKSVL